MKHTASCTRERKALEEKRRENLKVDQVLCALDGGTPFMKLPQ